MVIEASATTGAPMHARLVLEHGTRLFLVKSLVMHEGWAGRYAERPGTTVVDSVRRHPGGPRHDGPAGRSNSPSSGTRPVHDDRTEGPLLQLERVRVRVGPNGGVLDE